MPTQPIRTYWWRTEHQAQQNFGDEISPLLIREVFGRSCVWAAPHECQLVAAGSIIELILEFKGFNRPTLWGTGFMREEDPLLTERDCVVAAVRGARSRDRIEQHRDRVALGDPGLLASVLLPSPQTKTCRLGVLPHFLDARIPEVDWLREQDGVSIIDATGDPARVVHEIARCETLLSSSLHGLIVADSLGVPNAHLRLSDNRFIGSMFKFRDYYSVFEDPARHLVLNPAGVLGRGVEPTATHVEEHYRIPKDLPAIKEKLIAAFPLA